MSDLLPVWKNEIAEEVAEPETGQGDRKRQAGDTASARPAVADGGPLRQDRAAPVVLGESLRRAALNHSNRGIVYIARDGSEEFQCYPKLLEDAERVLAALRGLGLQPGDRVLFQFDSNRDFLTAFWGCILGGFVPAPLAIALTYAEPNSGLLKFLNAWRLLGHPLVLTGDGLCSAIRSLSGSPDFPGLRVEPIGPMLSCQPERQWHDSQSDDPALLMLTSGSTGMPKGVVLRHRNLLSRSAGSCQMNGFTTQDVTLNWMPLDHVAGLIYFHLRDVYLGCRQVHAPTDTVLQAPLKWLDWIGRYRATITFAPNFAFGLINDRWAEIEHSSWDLSSMRFVLNGAEAIVAKTARRFLQLLIPHGLPATAMYPVWGMSETSSGTTYSRKFSLDSSSDADHFVEVGAPIPGFSIRIVDERDEIVPEGAIGHLQVTGTTVTTGYFESPELNREAFTRDGWFRTGDLAFIKEGCLTITGREKDVIIINSVKYYCHEIESVVEEIEGVVTSNTAACGIRAPGGETDRLAVFFVPSSEDKSQLVEVLRSIRRKISPRRF